MKLRHAAGAGAPPSSNLHNQQVRDLNTNALHNTQQRNSTCIKDATKEENKNSDT